MRPFKCPNCNSPMKQGWLAIYDPLLLTKLVWQPVKPGYVRFRMPSDSELVIQPKLWGRGCPEALICKTCELVLFSYDKENVT